MGPSATFRFIILFSFLFPSAFAHAAGVELPVVAKRGKAVELAPVGKKRNSKRKCLFPKEVKAGSLLIFGECSQATTAFKLRFRKIDSGLQIRVKDAKRPLCIGLVKGNTLALEKCGSPDFVLKKASISSLRRIALGKNPKLCLSSIMGKVVVRNCEQAQQWLIKLPTAGAGASKPTLLSSIPSSKKAVAIRSKSSNDKCLVISKGNARGMAAPCPSTHPGWRFKKMKNGNFQIVSADNPRRCLQSSRKIYLTSGKCKSKGDWRIQKASSGYRIRPYNDSKKCLNSNKRGTLKIEGACKTNTSVWSFASLVASASEPSTSVPAGSAGLETVNFAFNKFRVGCRKSYCKKIRRSLRKIAKRILANAKPGSKIEIHGHADYIGSKYVNQYISEMRAKSVMLWLKRHGGLGKFDITIKWFGESKPLDARRTWKARKKNRRAEIRYIPA